MLSFGGQCGENVTGIQEFNVTLVTTTAEKVEKLVNGRTIAIIDTVKRRNRTAGRAIQKNVIPAEVKEEAMQAIDQFNQTNLADTGYRFVGRFQGKYLYLDREEYGQVGPICRLDYRGGKKGWGFAIYKFSTDRYDPQEWMFPGSELVDGTVEGAMKAGMVAYQ